MISKTLLMLVLLFTLAGAAWGQPKPTNSNDCHWWAPCSTAHCYARVESAAGVIINDFGTVGTYMAIVPTDPDHVSDCIQDADRFEQYWDQSQGNMCNAFAKTAGGELILYNKLGGGPWTDRGVLTASEFGYPQNCFSTPDVVHPKYYVLGLVYPLPGRNSSTPAGKCPTGTTATSLLYSTSSMAGTTTTIQDSLKLNVNLSYSVGSDKGGGTFSPFTFNAQFGYSTSSTTGNSVTTSGTTTSGIPLVGGGEDGVNQDFASFDLLMNPAVSLTSWLYPSITVL